MKRRRVHAFIPTTKFVSGHEAFAEALRDLTGACQWKKHVGVAAVAVWREAAAQAIFEEICQTNNTSSCARTHSPAKNVVSEGPAVEQRRSAHVQRHRVRGPRLA